MFVHAELMLLKFKITQKKNGYRQQGSTDERVRKKQVFHHRNKFSFYNIDGDGTYFIWNMSSGCKLCIKLSIWVDWNRIWTILKIIILCNQKWNCSIQCPQLHIVMHLTGNQSYHEIKAWDEEWPVRVVAVYLNWKVFNLETTPLIRPYPWTYVKS